MDNKLISPEIKKIFDYGERYANKKRKVFEKLGDYLIISLLFTPLIIFYLLSTRLNKSIILNIILSLSSIPIILFLTLILYLLSDLQKPSTREEIIKIGTKKIGGIDKITPNTVLTVNSKYLNEELDIYVKNNLSKEQSIIFYQLFNENYQGSINNLKNTVEYISL